MNKNHDFAALYSFHDKLLAMTLGGVGSKIKLAGETNGLITIGMDLVSVNVNNLLCTGATPFIFMDYISSGKIHPHIKEDILTGVRWGCEESQIELLDGKTAKVPGVYHQGDLDLVGFVLGEIPSGCLLDGSALSPRDTLIGLASNGFHTNGFSYIRKVIEDEHDSERKKHLLQLCLEPTRNYLQVINRLRNQVGKSLKGVANIGSHGLYDISKLNQNVDYQVNFLPGPNELIIGMAEIMERTGLNKQELCHTFNMGIGMVLITDSPEQVLETLQQEDLKCWVLGQVESGTGKLWIH